MGSIDQQGYRIPLRNVRNFNREISFWEVDRESTVNVRLAESHISVNRQVTDKVTELEKNSNGGLIFLNRSLLTKASVNGVFPKPS